MPFACSRRPTPCFRVLPCITAPTCRLRTSTWAIFVPALCSTVKSNSDKFRLHRIRRPLWSAKLIHALWGWPSRHSLIHSTGVSKHWSWCLQLDVSMLPLFPMRQWVRHARNKMKPWALLQRFQGRCSRVNCLRSHLLFVSLISCFFTVFLFCRVETRPRKSVDSQTSVRAFPPGWVWRTPLSF